MADTHRSPANIRAKPGRPLGGIFLLPTKWIPSLSRWKRTVLFSSAISLFFLLFSVVACQPTLLEAPRKITLTAQAISTTTPAPTPFFSAAPTSTPGAPTIPTREVDTDNNTEATITLWVNDSSAENEERMNRLAEKFTEQSSINLELVLVSPQLMPELVQTALISNTLPDLILHPVEFSAGWVNQEILDSQAASMALQRLGRDTFDPQALQMTTIEGNEEGDTYAALPSDGWPQLIIYRADWLENLGLETPTTYDSLFAAADAINNLKGNVAGIVVPTDASLASTLQVFEHIAMANGCDLVDSNGRVALLHPACLEALEFYRVLVNDFSPIGYQTDISALNAYLSGRTGIIVAPPSVLPALVGLDEQFVPACPECDDPQYLARNSGLISILEGNGEFARPAAFNKITALGITRVADQEAAATFVDYWFNDGYLDWIAIEPERKIPARLGTFEEPERFSQAWSQIPTRPGTSDLSQYFGSELDSMQNNDANIINRWGFAENQGALMTSLYEDLTLAALLQEMLSGYFTSSQTIIEMYLAVIDLIPGYAFPIELAPTPTPD